MIDKYPLLRKGMVFFIKSHFKDSIILDSSTIDAFFEKYPGQNPDLVILGISQNNSVFVNMLQIKLLKTKWKLTPLVVYDELPDFKMVMHYLNSGIKGYISKRNAMAELKECLQIVMDGEHYICKGIF